MIDIIWEISVRRDYTCTYNCEKRKNKTEKCIGLGLICMVKQDNNMFNEAGCDTFR